MSAYGNGFDTYFEGYDLSYNPHEEGTQAYIDWRDGWLDAEDYDRDMDW